MLYNTSVLNFQKSGSSEIGTSLSQKFSESGLFTNPETELPGFWKCIEEKLSYISNQKQPFSFHFTPELPIDFLEKAVIEIDHI